MNALGAFVGDTTGVRASEYCTGLFRQSRNVQALALDGAGVFAFDRTSPASLAPGTASFDDLIVVADARIDGRAELGRALGLAAATSAAAPAAELIAGAWRRWGADAPLHLIGDFAFLLWERRTHSLFLVRDFFGERPLHYRQSRDGLMAASLPGALAAASGSPSVDLFTLARYHALLPQTGADSFFDGIQRVEPGTVVRWRDGRLDIRRYWLPPPPDLRISREEAAEEVAAILRDSVRDRAAGATGVAAHLSAGMDSSAVCAAIADSGMEATVITGESARLDEAPPGFIASEAAIAAATAACYPRLRHIVARPTEQSIAALMQRWNLATDQPLRSIENGDWLEATHREAANAGASILMTGGFGNNSFSYAGTPYFGELLRTFRLGALIREARPYLGHHHARWRGIAAHALGPAIPQRLWRWYRGVPKPRQALAEATLFRPGHPIIDQLRERAAEDRHDLAERPASSAWNGRAREVRWVDNALFDHEPRRRWGVTVTDPMADRRLVEFTLRLPGHHWIEQGRTRALARRVLAGRVAPEVIDPPGRGMQGSGWRAAAEACLPELRAEVDRLKATPWGEMLDLPRMAAMLDHWPGSGWSNHGQLFLYRASLLRAISMGHFARVRSA